MKYKILGVVSCIGLLGLVLTMFNNMLREFETILKPMFSVPIENTISIFSTIILVISGMILIGVGIYKTIED